MIHPCPNTDSNKTQRVLIVALRRGGFAAFFRGGRAFFRSRRAFFGRIGAFGRARLGAFSVASGVVGQVEAAAFEDEAGAAGDDARYRLTGRRARLQRIVGDALFDLKRRPVFAAIDVGGHGPLFG